MRPIQIPERHDVLSGRGKFAMNWAGNIIHQTLIKRRKDEYIHAKLNDKKRISIEIVNTIYSLSPPGRFLKRGGNGKLLSSKIEGIYLNLCSDLEWYQMDRIDAVKKTRQALREDAHIYRLERARVENEESNQETESTKNEKTDPIPQLPPDSSIIGNDRDTSKSTHHEFLQQINNSISDHVIQNRSSSSILPTTTRKRKKLAHAEKILKVSIIKKPKNSSDCISNDSIRRAGPSSIMPNDKQVNFTEKGKQYEGSPLPGNSQNELSCRFSQAPTEVGSMPSCNQNESSPPFSQAPTQVCDSNFAYIGQMQKNTCNKEKEPNKNIDGAVSKNSSRCPASIPRSSFDCSLFLLSTNCPQLPAIDNTNLSEKAYQNKGISIPASYQIENSFRISSVPAQVCSANVEQIQKNKTESNENATKALTKNSPCPASLSQVSIDCSASRNTEKIIFSGANFVQISSVENIKRRENINGNTASSIQHRNSNELVSRYSLVPTQVYSSSVLNSEQAKKDVCIDEKSNNDENAKIYSQHAESLPQPSNNACTELKQGIKLNTISPSKNAIPNESITAVKPALDKGSTKFHVQLINNKLVASECNENFSTSFDQSPAFSDCNKNKDKAILSNISRQHTRSNNPNAALEEVSLTNSKDAFKSCVPNKCYSSISPQNESSSSTLATDFCANLKKELTETTGNILCNVFDQSKQSLGSFSQLIGIEKELNQSIDKIMSSAVTKLQTLISGNQDL